MSEPKPTYTVETVEQRIARIKEYQQTPMGVIDGHVAWLLKQLEQARAEIAWLAEGGSVQARVFENVEARGYLEKWTAQQAIARQACKLGEELGELAQLVNFDLCGANTVPLWDAFLVNDGKVCRAAFDDEQAWEKPTITDIEKARREVADLQVVLYVLATLLGMDLQADALAKSDADVARGKRNGGGG